MAERRRAPGPEHASPLLVARLRGVIKSITPQQEEPMSSLARIIVLLAAALALGTAHAQQSTIISIGTGGTGGVWYPLGGAMANILTKTVPGMNVTAEVTGGSVDNISLIRMGQSALGFSMVDAAWDAYRGQGKFKEKVELRTLAVFYPQKNHVITLEGSGIEKMADLRGKRVSIGSPGSGSEIIARRVLEAYGIDPDQIGRGSCRERGWA